LNDAKGLLTEVLGMEDELLENSLFYLLTNGKCQRLKRKAWYNMTNLCYLIFINNFQFKLQIFSTIFLSVLSKLNLTSKHSD